MTSAWEEMTIEARLAACAEATLAAQSYCRLQLKSALMPGDLLSNPEAVAALDYPTTDPRFLAACLGWEIVCEAHARAQLRLPPGGPDRVADHLVQMVLHPRRAYGGRPYPRTSIHQTAGLRAADLVLMGLASGTEIVATQSHMIPEYLQELLVSRSG